MVYETGNRTVDDAVRRMLDGECLDRTDGLALVARSGLGRLKHTALTVEALRRRDVPVLGVALNRYGGASVAERTTPTNSGGWPTARCTRRRRRRSPG